MFVLRYNHVTPTQQLPEEEFILGNFHSWNNNLAGLPMLQRKEHAVTFFLVVEKQGEVSSLSTLLD